MIFALAAPVVLWAGFVAIGKMRADTAGLLLIRRPGPPLPSNLALGAAAAGVGLAWLTAKLS